MSNDHKRSSSQESTPLLGQAPPPYAIEASGSSSTALSPQPTPAPAQAPPPSPPNLFIYVTHPTLQQQQRFAGPSPLHTLPFAELDTRRAIAAADRRARRRWVSAMFWGFFLWVGLSWCVGFLVEHSEQVKREARRGYKKSVRWAGKGERWGEEHIWGPDGVLHRWMAQDIDGVVSCAHFDSPSKASRRLAAMHPLSLVYAAVACPTQTATADFSIPLSAVDTLLFSGSGGWTAGQVEFKVDSSLVDTASVHIIATHDDAQLLHDAHVCQIADKRTAGLVIRTPSRYNVPTAPNTLLSFKIEIALPATLSAELLVQAHEFAVRGALPAFGAANKIEIVTANQPIEITEDIVASSVLLSTSNAVIRTRAISAKSVVLRSSNAELSTTSLDARSGVYTTSNKPIVLGLSTAFEGKILATTSNDAIALTGPHTKENKDGLARHLDIELTTPAVTEAKLYWGDKVGKDEVTLHTSNAPVSVDAL